MPIVTSGVLIVFGTVLCLGLVRLVRGGSFLARVLLASFALHVALAIALYLISAYQVPIFQPLQLPDGFWRFANDGPHYHQNAVRIAEAFGAGVALPQVLFGERDLYIVHYYDYFYFVGLIYWILGVHPLHVPLLNAMLWPAMAVLGYVLARWMNGEAPARLAAVAIGFWPSGFIWSSQILKDSLVIFLVLLSLCLLILMVATRRRLLALGAVGSVLALVFLIARLRHELAMALAVAAVVWLALHWLLSRKVRLSAILASCGLVAVVLTAPSIDPAKVLYPPGVSRVSQDAATPLARPQASQPSSARSGQEEPAPTEADERRLTDAADERRLTDAFDAIVASVQAQNPIGVISSKRRGFAGTGGGSAFATDVQFENVFDMVAFLPLGLAHTLYAPFPWEWFSPDGETGVFKSFAALETVLMVVLTPFALLAFWRAVRRRALEGWLLVIFAAFALAGMALILTNTGLLFRLRLQPLIPLLIFVCAYGIPVEKMQSGLARSLPWTRPKPLERVASVRT